MVGAAAAVPVGAALMGNRNANRVQARQNDLPSEVNEIIEQRELTPEDVTAAPETYMPSGKMVEFMMFTSSGHAGHVYAIGVPSMRNCKTIAVFTPEPMQGYGFSKETKAVLRQGDINSKEINHGDTHHFALSDYAEKYRRLCYLWKFDRVASRIVPDESFGIITPPYGHDLGDAGKGACEGFAFWNSINSELATGGTFEGNPTLEVGDCQRDMDYLHIVNYVKAAEVTFSDKAEEINGMRVVPMDVAVEEGLLFLVTEPKSPHGVDVTPDGRFLIISGKLAPHVTIFSREKITAALVLAYWVTKREEQK